MDNIEQAIQDLLTSHRTNTVMDVNTIHTIYRYLCILKWLKEGYYEMSLETQVEGSSLFLYTCKICGFEWYEDSSEKHSNGCMVGNFLRS